MRSIVIVVAAVWSVGGLGGRCFSDDAVRGMYLEARAIGAPAAPTLVSHVATASEAVDSVMGWRVRNGNHREVVLDGLAVVAVVRRATAEDGGQRQCTDVLIDANADDAQRDALIEMVKGQAAAAIGDIRSVKRTKFDLRIGEGCALAYAVLETDSIKLKTRRVLSEDRGLLDITERNGATAVKLFYSRSAIVSEWSESHSSSDRDSDSPPQDKPMFAKVGGFAQ